MGLRDRDLVPGKREKSRSGFILPVLLAIGIAVLVRVGIRTWLYEPVVVSEEAMAPRLTEGTVLYARKFFRPGDVGAGELVWIEHPLNPSYRMIRAVVGRPGDTVEVKHGQVLVNGSPVGAVPAAAPGKPEGATPESDESDRAMTLKAASFFDQAPRRLPDGSFFVLADAGGLDSRHFGPVPASRLLGVFR